MRKKTWKNKLWMWPMMVVMAVLSPMMSLTPVKAMGDLQPVVSENDYAYEVEDGVLSDSAFVSRDLEGFSGSGYVNIAAGKVTMDIDVPVAGKYRVYLVGSTENNAYDKCEKVIVNGKDEMFVLLKAADFGSWKRCEIGREAYPDNVFTPEPVTEGYDMTQGHNTITIQANWGYAYYDQLILSPVEKAVADVMEVIRLIDALPEVIEESHRNDVNYAKKAYDALEESQKAQVTNYAKLQAALVELVQKPTIQGNQLIYEAEYSDFLGTGGFVGNTFPGYSGTGYAFVMTDGFEMRIYVPKEGTYRLMVAGANDANGGRCETINVNGGTEYLIATPARPERTWVLSEPGTENWINDELKPQPVEEGFYFKAGENSIKIKANWGYAAYDRVILIPTESQSTVVDVDNVEKVNSMIANLPEVIIAADAKAVKEAVELYEALSDKDKEGVTNKNKLFCAKAAIQALEADAKAPEGTLRFECEEGNLEGNTAVVTGTEVFQQYSGKGYVFLFDQQMTIDVYVPKSGYYDIRIVSGLTENANKCDYVSVNGGEKYLVSTVGKQGTWVTSRPGTEFWKDGVLKPEAPKGGFYLKEGKNTVTISANWGYCAYDSIIVTPYGLAPKTGDDTIPMGRLWLLLMLSSAGIGLTVYGQRKGRQNEV